MSIRNLKYAIWTMSNVARSSGQFFALLFAWLSLFAPEKARSLQHEQASFGRRARIGHRGPSRICHGQAFADKVLVDPADFVRTSVQEHRTFTLTSFVGTQRFQQRLHSVRSRLFVEHLNVFESQFRAQKMMYWMDDYLPSLINHKHRKNTWIVTFDIRIGNTIKKKKIKQIDKKKTKMMRMDSEKQATQTIRSNNQWMSVVSDEEK